MKKLLITFSIIAVSFTLGYAFKSIIAHDDLVQTEPGRITGIGGIFFKCKNPQKMREWYQQHFGMNTNRYGTVFEWYQGADSTKKGFSQWSPFKETTKYFEPSAKDFMINYRVNNLQQLVSDLKKNGITTLDTIESYDYGKFVHLLDPEGNKIELWEPYDIEYEKMGLSMKSKTTK